MAIIAPTITTDDRAVYADRIDEYGQFAPAIHLDITDGKFAPSQTLSLNQMYWPDKRDFRVHVHLMVEDPVVWASQLVSMSPDYVIVQAESQEANIKLPKLSDYLKKFDISVGLALLADTPVELIKPIIDYFDGVLLFGGHLGYQGGQANLSVLDKIAEVKALKSDLVIGYDGGANSSNIAQIVQAGVDVVNVGSAIEQANDRRVVFTELQNLADQSLANDKN